MESNQRLLTILVLSTALAAGYFFWAGPEDQDASHIVQPPNASATPAESTPSGNSTSEARTQLTAEERQSVQQTSTIRTAYFLAEIDNLGGGISSYVLTGEEHFDERNLISTNREEYQSARLRLGGVTLPEDIVWQAEQVSETEVRLQWEGNGVRIVRRFTAGQGPYQLWLTTQVTNLEDHDREVSLGYTNFHYVQREEESGGFIGTRSPGVSEAFCSFGDEVERKDRDTLTENGAHGYGQSNNVNVAAVQNVYFTQALAPHGQHQAARCAMYAEDRGVPEATGTLFETRLTYPTTTLEPNQVEIWQTLAYFGPKEEEHLLTAGHRVSSVIDLGFFGLIARYLAILLAGIQSFVGSWGFAIILLTIMVRLTLFPLTARSFKSMAKMRRLKPKMDHINELYADDREKKGEAIMQLYKKEGVNPLGGCLPQLLQLPVFWALYTSLSTNIELYHRNFGIWTDLSAPDPYFALPLSLGVLMHVQQRLSPTNMDPNQARMMMYFMPLMITGMMLFLPSGLCLYMVTSSVLGIGQQRLSEYLLVREEANLAAKEGTDDNDDHEPEHESTPDSDDRLNTKSTTSRKNKRGAKRQRRARRG